MHKIKFNSVKTLVTLFVLFMVAAIILIIYYIMNPCTIEILVAPESSTITINDKVYKNGTYRMPVGEYHLSISKDGFISQEYDFELKYNDQKKLFYILEQTDGTSSWYEEHPEDNELVYEIGVKLNNLTREEYFTDFPFAGSYPIFRVEPNGDSFYIYRVDLLQSSECKSKICFKITDFSHNSYDKAIAAIESTGVDVSKNQIIYDKNPAYNKENDDLIINDLPYKNTNSFGNEFGVSFTYTEQGELFLLINNYSCDNEAATEFATIRAVNQWLLLYNTTLENYQYGILTFCEDF